MRVREKYQVPETRRSLGIRLTRFYWEGLVVSRRQSSDAWYVLAMAHGGLCERLAPASITIPEEESPMGAGTGGLHTWCMTLDYSLLDLMWEFPTIVRSPNISLK